VDRVLARYTAQLPLTVRQVWYSLISDGVLVKEERTYKQTVELLGWPAAQAASLGTPCATTPKSEPSPSPTTGPTTSDADL
jgi:hypothetical protein